MRRYRRRRRRPTDSGGWGDLIEGWEVGVVTEYTAFDDEAALATGNVSDTELSFFRSLGDTSVGFGFTAGHISTGHPISVDATDWGLNLHLTYTLNESWDVGVLAMGSRIDTNDFNGNGYSLTGGVMTSFHTEIGSADVGITPILTGTSTDTDEETTLLCMVDAALAGTDMLSVWPYAIWTQALSSTDQDSSFVNVGLEVRWAITDQLECSLGYERTIKLDDYEDHKGMASVIYQY